MKNRAVGRLGILTASVALAAGCSLINSYDDVLPFKDAGVAPGDDAGGPSPDASSEGGTDSGGGTDATTEDVVTVPDAGPPQGFVVVAGLEKLADGGANYVLSVVDPVDGGERSREHMNTVAVVYDPHGDQGAGTGEVWYVMETPDAGNRAAGSPSILSQIFTGPTTRVVLRSRKLDVRTGKWTDLGSADIPPPRTADQIVALANRLSYIAYGDAGLQMVTLDTTNPAAISADASSGAAVFTDLPEDGGSELQLVGMAGTPDNTNNPVGGTVTLLEKECTVGTCQFQLRGMTVKSTGVVFKTPAPVGNTFASGNPSPGFGNFANYDVVALPAPDLTATSAVKELDRNTHGESLSVPFTPNTTDLKPLAFSTCLNAAFVCERLSNNLSVVPFAAGMGGNKIDWGFRCSSEVFEPYTSSVVLPFMVHPNFALRRVPVTKSGNNVTLGGATNLGPTDLAPYQVAARQPPTFVCP